MKASVDEQLNFAKEHIIRTCNQEGTFPTTPDGLPYLDTSIVSRNSKIYLSEEMFSSWYHPRLHQAVHTISDSGTGFFEISLENTGQKEESLSVEFSMEIPPALLNRKHLPKKDHSSFKLYRYGQSTHIIQ